MELNDVFPSRFLKGDDLDGDLIVTISGVMLETFKNRDKAAESKPVCHFTEDGVKPLILNKTNWQTIAKLHGKKSDGWHGKRIALYAKEVEAFGEMVNAVRVRDRVPVRPANTRPPAQETPAGDDTPPLPDEPPGEEWA